jgi:hypothetical protein
LNPRGREVHLTDNRADAEDLLQETMLRRLLEDVACERGFARRPAAVTAAP